MSPLSIASSDGGVGGEKKLKNDSAGLALRTRRVRFVSATVNVSLSLGRRNESHLLLLRCFLISNVFVRSLSSFHSIGVPIARS